jgi:hypothetical protein
MSNKIREVVPKKRLLIEIALLRDKLREANDQTYQANKNLESLEADYIKYKSRCKSITDKSLFLALFSAFRLWQGERR